MQELLEALGGCGRVELEVDHDVLVVFNGLLDALGAHAGARAGFDEPVERPLPDVNVADRMLDLQRGHRKSSVAAARYAGQYAQRGRRTIPRFGDLSGPVVPVTLAFVASRWSRERAVSRILQLAASTTDAQTLRVGVLGELRRVIDFDAYVWVLTDPQTWVGAAPLADVPCVQRLPELIRLKYLTPVNRWTTLRRGQVALLDKSTRGNLGLSLVWRELLASYDVIDVASTAFRDRYGCWGFLDLWRVGARVPFSVADANALASVVADVTVALRRAQAATFTMPRAEPYRQTGAAVLLLSPGLDVRAQTPETHDYLTRLLPPSEGGSPIPAIAYNAAAQLLANEAGVDDHAPSTRVHLSAGQWLTLRAARIGDSSTATSADIAVTIEGTTAADRLPLFASAFGLSRRETEVLAHLGEGRDTRDVAAALFVSEHTVRDHLKSILTKTRTRSRGAALSAALGTPSG